METVLERLTGLVAAFSVLVIALSVSHEFGYFAYLGGGFFQTFVTATDYFTNAILWVPVAVITVIGWWNQDWLWKNPPRPKRGDWKSWIFPSVLIGGPILMFAFMREGISLLYLIWFIYIWILVFDRIVPKANPEVRLSAELRNLSKIAGPVCAALFTLGFQSAKDDLKSVRDPYLVQLKGAEHVTLRIPLRNFDKGILVRDPVRNRIEFVRWDNIESVSKLSDPGPPTTIGCLWFGVWCREASSAL